MQFGELTYIALRVGFEKFERGFDGTPVIITDITARPVVMHVALTEAGRAHVLRKMVAVRSVGALNKLFRHRNAALEGINTRSERRQRIAEILAQPPTDAETQVAVQRENGVNIFIRITPK